MHATFRHSAAPRSSRRPSIFPSRPDLKAATRSSRRRRNSHVRAWALLVYVQLLQARGSLLLLRCSYPRSYLCPSSKAPHPRRTYPVERFGALVAEASDRFAVPARWIRAVMKNESGGEREVSLLVEQVGAP
jgi:hypothetical protein